MKQGLSLLIIGLLSSALIYAQDAGVSQAQTQADQGSSGSGPYPASVPDSGKKGNGSGSYGSEGYGGRADIFVSGFWLFTTSASGNSIHQQATETGGFAAVYRFRLNSWSALEGRYGFADNSQKYGINGTTASIPSYLAEVTGRYVYNFRQFHRIQPFDFKQPGLQTSAFSFISEPSVGIAYRF